MSRVGTSHPAHADLPKTYVLYINTTYLHLRSGTKSRWSPFDRCVVSRIDGTLGISMRKSASVIDLVSVAVLPPRAMPGAGKALTILGLLGPCVPVFESEAGGLR